MAAILIQFPGDSALNCFFGSDVVATTLLLLPQHLHRFCHFDIDCVTWSGMFLQITLFSKHLFCATLDVLWQLTFPLQPWAYRFPRIMYRLNFVIGNERMVDSLSIGALLKFFFSSFLSVFASNAAFGRLNGTTFKRKLNSTHHERSKWSAYKKISTSKRVSMFAVLCCCQLDTIAININESLSMYCAYTPLCMVWWRKKQQFVIDRVV